MQYNTTYTRESHLKLYGGGILKEEKTLRLSIGFQF